MRRSSRRQVEIFNFSFLDILACTIGLLIFIMVMVFVLQSGTTALADYSKLIAKDNHRADALRTQSNADDAIAARLEEQTGRMASLVDKDLVNRRSAAKTVRDAASAKFDEGRRILSDAQSTIESRLQAQDDLTNKLKNADAALAEAQRRHDQAAKRQAELLKQAQAGNILLRPTDDAANTDCLFIDCKNYRVVLWMQSTTGPRQFIGSVKLADIDGPASLFTQQITGHENADHFAVVFYIRPDGISTYEKAQTLLPADMKYGYEPASADWSFGIESK